MQKICSLFLMIKHTNREVFTRVTHNDSASKRTFMWLIIITAAQFLLHSVSLATYKAVFPNHSSAKHRYGFREKFQISLEIMWKFLSGNLHYRSNPRALPPASILCSLCLSSSGKEKLFHGFFSMEKKLGNTDWQNYNRIVKAQSPTMYVAKYTMYSGLRAMNIADRTTMQCWATGVTIHTRQQYTVELPRRDNATLLCQRCDTTYRTTQHG
jgi:hypothetical protein